MNSCDILVHFQGKQEWCALVHTANFEFVTVHQVSEVALSRYNSVFHTQFNISQCSVGLIENFDDENVKILENPQKTEIKSSNQEILLLLPDQISQPEHQLSINDYIHFNHQTILFLQQYHFAAARECLKLVKKVTCSPDNQSMTPLKPIKGLTERGYEVLDQDPPNQDVVKLKYPLQFNIENPPLSHYIAQCYSPTITKKQMKNNLREIVKSDPSLALEIALRNPDVFTFVPKLCEDQKVLTLLPQKIKTLQIKPNHLTHFTETFLSHGSLSQIMYFLSEVRESVGYGEPYITRYYALFLLINREFGKLHEVLLKFFRANQSLEINTICLGLFYMILEKMKTNNSPNIPVISPKNVNRLTPSEIQILNILMIAAVYLFVKGEIEYFAFFRNFIDPILSSPNNLQVLRQTSFISLFRACHSASLHIQESVKSSVHPKIFIIGDECAAFCSNRSYEDVGPVDCHLFDAMPIGFLREELKAPAKTSFWNRIKESEKYEILVLVFGNIDFRTTIPTILTREFDASFDSIFERLAKIYISLIEKVHQMVPKVGIVIHEVFDFFQDTRLMVRKYNEYIRTKFPSYVTVIEMPKKDVNPFSTDECPPKEYYVNVRNALKEAKNNLNKQTKS
ncbi:hypothetical protein TRFO_26647 [Tritrichomonas foetus]|uniref:Uncharacterized protein n=1 Tax=Tritrichomonas foetus TaxID=1144522 RepID=A0A1J4K2F6_9EUKA|nr:hypothetical protein TRFO_26647 [Tritrichomonas foetus]|eukprot:OHT05575.1 hypothetical protein TRFO_26647 [Tritrichomonas foetus]